MGVDKLSPHPEIQQEADSLLATMSMQDLDAMYLAISESLQVNPQYARDFQYWSTLKQQARARYIKLKVTCIYEQCLCDRESQVKQVIQTEQPKVLTSVVKQTLAEKIKKTALNTGIRFNIVDSHGFDNSSVQMISEIQKQGLAEDEVEFTDILQDSRLAPKEPVTEGSVTYVPRKPRYWNSVKQGYEWNKYNQVHYDQDNPPPKMVQGYKFNLFYPDLFDKTKAPQFYLENDLNSEDTLIIRFKASAPYEEIAFTIVNREWEMSERHGFRCSFDRGIL